MACADKVCCCCSKEAGINFLGIVELNLTLYFWASFFTFTKYYWFVALIIALMYTGRTYVFFKMALDRSESNRKFYHMSYFYSFIGVIVLGVLTVILQWVEWTSFPADSIWWALLCIWNGYYNYVLKGYAAEKPEHPYLLNKDVDGGYPETNELLNNPVPAAEVEDKRVSQMVGVIN